MSTIVKAMFYSYGVRSLSWLFGCVFKESLSSTWYCILNINLVLHLCIRYRQTTIQVWSHTNKTNINNFTTAIITQWTAAAV